MAANPTMARTYARLYTEEQLNTVLKRLADSLVEPDDIVNQYLEAEGWTVKVKSMTDRMMLMETIEAALDTKDGRAPINNRSTRVRFGSREIE
jgi:hypothetical protein